MGGLSPFPAAIPPPVDSPTNNYPDGTENAKPDKYIRQHITNINPIISLFI